MYTFLCHPLFRVAFFIVSPALLIAVLLFERHFLGALIINLYRGAILVEQCSTGKVKANKSLDRQVYFMKEIKFCD